ncbi:MAG: glycosyltransferase family 4 protein, partial [Deltaproteobacteria bacterium]|nr:glycosyltransferase family 4 protein [Deltaproteobacteria bacterium]
FVGRLVEEKGLPVLLEAWAIVVRRVPGAILNIVGEGPLEEALKALVQRLGIMSSVRFHGHQETVIPFLQAAALFVLPSYVEGLSNTLLEAMAMELPVVATRISGSEDVVDDGVTGLLVPPGDVPALAQALGALLKDTGHTGAMGRQARKRVIQLCSLEQVTHAYLQLYQDIAKDGARLCAESPVS